VNLQGVAKKKSRQGETALKRPPKSAFVIRDKVGQKIKRSKKVKFRTATPPSVRRSSVNFVCPKGTRAFE